IDAARPYYEEALSVFRDLGDEHGVASAVANLGWADHYAGRNDAALDRLRTALVVYRREDRHYNIAITLRGIALTEAESGAYADAVVHATEALAILDLLGSRLSVAMALNCLGWAHFRSGHHDEAAAAYRRALVVGEQAASRHEMARAETGLGNVAAAQDRLAEAQRYWQRAEERGIELNTAPAPVPRARGGGRTAGAAPGNPSERGHQPCPRPCSPPRPNRCPVRTAP
ncbi:MAG TPA: tetratricopeptide repeat protein, partial [Pseudonocardiaceae bacterium]